MNRSIAKLGLVAAVMVVPAVSLACDACGKRSHKARKAVRYEPAASYVYSANYAAPACAPVACAPACSTGVSFNPFSIVGGGGIL